MITTSAEVKNLFAAIVKFQSEVKPIKKTAVNPFFNSKYAPLESCIEDTRPILVKHGLGVIQMPTGENGITTRIIHDTGEWLEDTFTMEPVDQKPQSKGSAITYGRRYALGALLGLSTEDDDDGNAASKAKEKQGADEKEMENIKRIIEKNDAAGIKKAMAGVKVSTKYTDEQKKTIIGWMDARMKNLPDGEPVS